MSTITAVPTPAVDPAPSALGTSATSSRLGRYTERDTEARREIAHLPIADGSVLVVDRLSGTHGDARLLARLAADEPDENAQILCALYLEDESRGRCRPVTAADLDAAPTTETPDACAVRELRDDDGILYRVQTVAMDRRFPELRWTRSILALPAERFETVRLREVIARFEDYEPARSITAHALATHRSDRTSQPAAWRPSSRGSLRARSSSTVGYAKPSSHVSPGAIDDERDRHSLRPRQAGPSRQTSGETSWLARRIGLASGGRGGPADAMGAQRHPGADRARRPRREPQRGRTVNDRGWLAVRADPIPMVARLRRAREVGIGPAPGGARERRDGGPWLTES